MSSFDVFSNPEDLRFALRWAAIISDEVKEIDIAASTGVHNADSAIKMILAGADAVQLCSVLYKKGVSHIREMLEQMEIWMAKQGYDSIKNFKGNMSYKSIKHPELYQRSQFMKYFSNYE